ncbi:MAG: cytochrome c oxidase accessory protein CcoG [Gammaproteobacteria bacterium]|nr:cytochrome c oxidase accessory protein CcoG [Gammaproteobacteria bacterium]MDH3412609.1 cytochrome c oxidase accessory protein CcoG [Gammaproteobacteria bacterium]
MSSTDASGGASVRFADDVERSLYAKREKVYPREVHGVFAALRVTAVLVLLGLFYGVCWLRWDGKQLLLFDLPGRKFHVFGWTLFPQDFPYLTFMLIIAALSLFLFTAVAGRLFCGYACPQTVWTEVFLWLERKVEGDRQKQMKLDKSPWTGRKLLIKSSKHAIWIAFSLWTGFTFVGYFTPITELGSRLLALNLGPWETFWSLFYGFATYGNAGWMREQVCIYMCPYARFQSAMFDRDTLIISYDKGRGEPRGSRKKSLDHRSAGLGDCIDCTICVQVCPTGIDIREGLQYQCIACAACVDACDQVMERMNYPKGLIRYTSENAVGGAPARISRPRVVIYGVILLGLAAALGVSLALRTPLILDVIRDRNALYRETPEGLVENVYTLKIVNMDDADHDFSISVRGIEGVELLLDRAPVEVAGGEVLSIPVRLRVDPYSLENPSSRVVFELAAMDNPSLRVETKGRFLGPSVKQ